MNMIVELYGESKKKIESAIKQLILYCSDTIMLCKHTDYVTCTKIYNKCCKKRLYDIGLAKKIYNECKCYKIEINIE